MKGTITRCLSELVETRWGKDRWLEILADADVPAYETSVTMASADVDDRVAIRLLESTSKVLGVTAEQAYDAFGEYWCCTYAPKLYGPIVRRFKNAREMIVGLDHVHVEMTRSITNARPPRFDYRWADERTLIVTYKSPRNLLGVYIGLARGVGKYFKEALTVSASSANTVRIAFR